MGRKAQGVRECWRRLPKSSKKISFWVTFYQFLRLQEKSYQDCSFHASWHQFYLKLFPCHQRHTSSARLPLFFLVTFENSYIVLQISYKVISAFPKTLRHWVCHFHWKLKKKRKIMLKQQMNYYLINCLFRKILRSWSLLAPLNLTLFLIRAFFCHFQARDFLMAFFKRKTIATNCLLSKRKMVDLQDTNQILVNFKFRWPHIIHFLW